VEYEQHAVTGRGGEQAMECMTWHLKKHGTCRDCGLCDRCCKERPNPARCRAVYSDGSCLLLQQRVYTARIGQCGPGPRRGPPQAREGREGEAFVPTHWDKPDGPFSHRAVTPRRHSSARSLVDDVSPDALTAMGHGLEDSGHGTGCQSEFLQSPLFKDARALSVAEGPIAGLLEAAFNFLPLSAQSTDRASYASALSDAVRLKQEGVLAAAAAADECVDDLPDRTQRRVGLVVGNMLWFTVRAVLGEAGGDFCGVWRLARDWLDDAVPYDSRSQQGEVAELQEKLNTVVAAFASVLREHEEGSITAQTVRGVLGLCHKSVWDAVAALGAGDPGNDAEEEGHMDSDSDLEVDGAGAGQGVVMGGGIHAGGVVGVAGGVGGLAAVAGAGIAVAAAHVGAGAPGVKEGRKPRPRVVGQVALVRLGLRHRRKAARRFGAILAAGCSLESARRTRKTLSDPLVASLVGFLTRYGNSSTVGYGATPLREHGPNTFIANLVRTSSMRRLFAQYVSEACAQVDAALPASKVHVSWRTFCTVASTITPRQLSVGMYRWLGC